MDQKTAREEAERLHGIAVEAWPSAKGWSWGGWSGAQHPGQQWIVISLDRKSVLKSGADLVGSTS